MRGTYRMLGCAVLMLGLLATPVFAGENSISPGTRINKRNWRQYSEFMSAGLQALFSGDYFWKIPDGAEIRVGRTLSIPLPRQYRQDTAAFSGQVTLKPLAGGGTALDNYVAGVPFPVPAEPYLAAKVLWNLYYRYNPHVLRCVLDGRLVDRYLNVNVQSVDYVTFKLSHLSEPGMPHTLPGSQNIYLTDYFEFIAPEQKKYLIEDSVIYDDPARINEIYTFVPSMRRVLRLSSAARCAPGSGSDFTNEDLRYGFYGQPPLFSAGLEAERTILALVHADPGYASWRRYIPSLYFPTPEAGLWELRQVYVISLRRIGADAGSYCYGKRVIYVDKETWAPLAVESYDRNLKLWKVHLIGYRPTPIGLGDGEVTLGAAAAAGFDHLVNLQNEHISATMSRDVLANDEAGKYRDVRRYGFPSGLQQIMQ